MNRLFLFLLLLLPLSVFAQSASIGGKVVDARSGKPLGQVSVSAHGVAVVTNDDGVFTLKLDQPAQQIHVSHVGYHSKRVHVSAGSATDIVVKLSQAVVQLDEVVVTNLEPRSLVDAAIGIIPANYSARPELLRGFYRETAMKRRHYIYVAEGVEDIYKTSYRQQIGSDRVAIVKGRRLLSQTKSDTLGVKVMGGPVQAVVLDVVKNRDLLFFPDDLDAYRYSYGEPEVINDRLQYVVLMEPFLSRPYALFHGKLYIDQERLAFTRIELDLDMADKDKATSVMLVKKPLGVRFKPRELQQVADYAYEDGVTRLSYIKSVFRFNCDWKKRLFSTSFAATCEMVVTDHQSDNVKPIASRDSFDKHDSYYDKVEHFLDPAFWADYNIIEPSQSLDKAILQLLSKYKKR